MKHAAPLAFLASLLYLSAGPALADMWGYNLRGNDYANLDIRCTFWADTGLKGGSTCLARQCKRLCSSDRRCKAWSSVLIRQGSRSDRIATAHGRCDLKDAVPAAVSAATYVSGIKPGPRTVQRPSAVQRFEPRTNRPGNDYDQVELDGNDPRQCQRLCDEASRCQAWTWVTPGIQGEQARCWLKDAVPSPKTDACCVSGTKR